MPNLVTQVIPNVNHENNGTVSFPLRSTAVTFFSENIETLAQKYLSSAEVKKEKSVKKIKKTEQKS